MVSIEPRGQHPILPTRIFHVSPSRLGRSSLYLLSRMSWTKLAMTAVGCHLYSQ